MPYHTPEPLTSSSGTLSEKIDDLINHQSLKDFVKYIAVGGIAFMADYAVLYSCLSVHLHYLIATFLGFLTGLTLNYLLCLKWIWKGSKATTLKDILVFTTIGVMGLGITALLMWLSVDILNIDARIAKIYTAALVLLWNFSLRKIFVFFH